MDKISKDGTVRVFTDRHGVWLNDPESDSKGRFLLGKNAAELHEVIMMLEDAIKEFEA